METNIRGTYTLLESISSSSNQIESIIIASSDKAYGDYPLKSLPYKESYELKPNYPYDTSKACADMIAKSYAYKLYKLPSMSFFSLKIVIFFIVSLNFFGFMKAS